MLFDVGRCWWQMLKTKCVGESLKMLVTVLAILVTNIHYLFYMSVGHHQNFVTSVQKLVILKLTRFRSYVRTVKSLDFFQNSVVKTWTMIFSQHCWWPMVNHCDLQKVNRGHHSSQEKYSRLFVFTKYSEGIQNSCDHCWPDLFCCFGQGVHNQAKK